MERDSLKQLLETPNPAWPELRSWIQGAANPVEVLPARREAGERTILNLQVSTSATLGAVALYTGGILIDGGWLRILGSGHPRLPASLLDWNGLGEDNRMASVGGALIVAHDLIGGFFAVNAGGIPGPEGNVFYFAPDTRRWEDCEVGYTNFIRWAFDGDLAGFYNDLRWPDWEEDAAALSGAQGIHLWPPPWMNPTREMDEASRRVVSMQELRELVFTGRPPPPPVEN